MGQRDVVDSCGVIVNVVVVFSELNLLYGWLVNAGCLDVRLGCRDNEYKREIVPDERQAPKMANSETSLAYWKNTGWQHPDTQGRSHVQESHRGVHVLLLETNAFETVDALQTRCLFPFGCLHHAQKEPLFPCLSHVRWPLRTCVLLQMSSCRLPYVHLRAICGRSSHVHRGPTTVRFSARQEVAVSILKQPYV